MVKLFKYLRAKDWAVIFASFVLIVGQVWLELTIPEYMKEITTLVQTPGSAMIEIWRAGGFMLLCALGSMASAIVVGFFAARLSATFSMRVRSAIFDKVESFSMYEINKFSTASLITRSTNDVTQVQMLIAMGLQLVIKAPIMAVWAIIKIVDKNWQWSALTGGAVLIMLLTIGVIILFAIPRFKKIQTLTDNVNNVTRENITGIRVVRAYNAESYQEQKFEVANEELTHTNLVAQRIMAIMNPMMSGIMNGLSLGIYWIGAIILNNSTANIADKVGVFGDMVVFSSYAMQVIMSFMMLSMIFIMLPRAAVSAKRITEVLLVKPSIADGAGATDVQEVGTVEFKNVGFKYPGGEEYVLYNINFKASRGETVAFIGSTGSGKSTLVNLVPRFYDATEGEVLVDGVNVKDYTQTQLLDKIGYVPQRSVLFSGTVESNIKFGQGSAPKTDEDVDLALDISQSTGFVNKMEGKKNARIAQGGTNVSGGQKQRLSIARAIARKPEIFVFDDSFSALDYKTDKELRKRLKTETGNSTSLIVAQRISTIQGADKIIVLDEGRVVGVGRHKELLANCEIYKEIALSQLSKEELAK